MSRPSPQTDRLLALVDYLMEKPGDGVTLAELARAVGVSKATIHPMVVTLARRGWLLRHPTRRTYRLGPALVAVGRAVVAGDNPLELAGPAARQLAADTGLLCLALVPSGGPGQPADLLVGEIGLPPDAGGPLAAATVTGWRAQAVRLRLGDRIPPRPPMGAVCVAWADEDVVEAWLARLGADRPADARARVAPGLAGVRDRGWAVEVEDHLHRRLNTLVGELEEQHGPLGHAATLRRLMTEVSRGFDLADALPARVDPVGDYRATAISAPVFDRAGAVAAVLCLVCAPPEAWPDRSAVPVLGSEILRLGEAVRATADAVTRRGDGRFPRR